MQKGHMKALTSQEHSFGIQHASEESVTRIIASIPVAIAIASSETKTETSWSSAQKGLLFGTADGRFTRRTAVIIER